MNIREQTFFASVASGATLSDVVELAGARFVGINVPSVTSCALHVQAAVDANAANMRRLLSVAGDGDLSFAVGPGSRYAFLEAMQGAAAMRLECGVAQADTRSFSILARF